MAWKQLDDDTEVLPFLESAPKEKKEKEGLPTEIIEQYLDDLLMTLSDEE